MDVDQWVRAQPPAMIARQRYSNAERDYFLKRCEVLIESLAVAQGREVERMLEAREWFKISEFGVEGDKAGWLLVYHADRLPELQKKVLATLEGLVALKETTPSNYAYLCDRVAVNDRRGQRYGTQGRLVSGAWKPYRLEPPEGEVDARRKSVGLEPLAAYARRFC